MLHDKKTDTDAERRKVLLRRLVSELSKDNPDLYYQSTSQISRLLKDHISAGKSLNGEDRKLMEPLSCRDLEVLLSLH
ncbi:hypothetical protein J7426_09050 [Tropicibacter sp. R16_0]|uniref:hypothetical protein n=1 Tax=Tropicibacter sp. R16_0 TaxID=2821102 RepID=UPI001AD997FA|nr:hypothetical protein [Tropicibacter sp. R16_0]MBO9450400.1 hypothetical protein [Tropicibacter sp. R16_0]